MILVVAAGGSDKYATITAPVTVFRALPERAHCRYRQRAVTVRWGIPCYVRIVVASRDDYQHIPGAYTAKCHVVQRVATVLPVGSVGEADAHVDNIRGILVVRDAGYRESRSPQQAVKNVGSAG